METIKVGILGAGTNGKAVCVTVCLEQSCCQALESQIPTQLSI